MLVGREPERARLDALLQSARDERSAVLVLRGEAGIGKTALVEYAAQRAADMNVLRCVGIEAEHELPFAGIQQLVRPCLRLIDRLPPPQQAALRGALGLSADPVGDRFLVSLGLLSLLAESCEERPTLCCVDDAQWLDRPSAEALLFAARRFEAEPIAVRLAVREGERRRFETPGLAELELDGLDPVDSRAVLEARLDGTPSPAVLDTLLNAAAGNPLALLELPAALSSSQLRGDEPILGPPPVRPAVEEAFRRRAEALPEAAARVLLIAASEETGDLAAIQDAAARLGLDPTELEAAEREGLVQLNGVVGFRHPLVRSAVYRSASRGQRKAVHEALAAVVADPARAAWHRALVADRPDETIAEQLEAAGSQAVDRGAHATASAALERAADLSEQPARKGHLLTRAAQASIDAGWPEAGMALVERARPLVEGPVDEATLNLACSAVVGRRGSTLDAYALVVEAAEKLADVAPDMALELVLWSLLAGHQGGWEERIVGQARQRVAAIDASGESKRFAVLFLDASQAVMDGDLSRARELFDAAAAGAEAMGAGTVLSYGAGPSLFLASVIHMTTGDMPRARELLAGGLAANRSHGGITALAGTLPLCAFVELRAGRPAVAAALTAEALGIAEQLSFDNDRTACLAVDAGIAALQGREQDCRERAESALRHGTANELGLWTTAARRALAELELGLGNPHEALDQIGRLGPTLFPPEALMATPQLIEAALRVDDRERADQALERFAAWAGIGRSAFLDGVLARCRAMLAENAGDAQRLFEEALAHHAGVSVLERARTHLAYGERLQRGRRADAARAQLRSALDLFEGLGARLWAERAREELDATGETARAELRANGDSAERRTADALSRLTARELQIVRLVAEGLSDRDVAARLLLSPRTIAAQLSSVFAKLGISSRVELAAFGLSPEVSTGVLRSRLARAGLAELFRDLRTMRGPALQDALARTLGDPELVVAYRAPAPDVYTDAHGNPVTLPAAGGDRAVALLERDGREMAALVYDAALDEDPELVQTVCAAAGIALENEHLQIESQARLAELRASRQRIVAAGDAERRRLERNLHDGAQQQLVALALQLRLIQSGIRRDPDAAVALVTTASDQLAQSLAELRELARGIHPAVLNHGLESALESLAGRATVPTAVFCDVPEGLSQEVELAVYFVGCEALANIAKYAEATTASVRVAPTPGGVAIEIADDGVGGADAAGGTGLRGLADRVEALGGSLLVTSPRGAGTVITAELPC
jgi:signal transduction histidine kinase